MLPSTYKTNHGFQCVALLALSCYYGIVGSGKLGCYISLLTDLIALRVVKTEEINCDPLSDRMKSGATHLVKIFVKSFQRIQATRGATQTCSFSFFFHL